MSKPMSLMISLGLSFMMMLLTLISRQQHILPTFMNFTTAMYSLYMYSMINYNNQLKMMNTSTHMSSINLLTSISHIWPMLIMSMIQMKLMLWC